MFSSMTWLKLHIRVLLFDVLSQVLLFRYIVKGMSRCQSCKYKYNNNRGLKQVKFFDSHKPEVNFNNFACQNHVLSQICKLIVSTCEKITNNINVVDIKKVS